MSSAAMLRGLSRLPTRSHLVAAASSKRHRHIASYGGAALVATGLIIGGKTE